MGQIHAFAILLVTVALAVLAKAAPPQKGPSLWELFNATDPGPEYWAEQLAVFRNSSHLQYLHNDIYIPEDRQGMAGSEWRWPEGMIPVRIDPHWSANARSNIVKGMEYLQSNTCIRFETYDSSNPKHSRFVKIEPAEADFGCRSLIGRWNMPEGQWVKLEPNQYCLSPGTVTHELIHSVGFWHEHQRPDRDDYVWINYDNIPSDRWTDFEKKNDLGIFDTPYDYGSIMHYFANAVAIDPNQDTIISKTDTPVAGQEEYLTEYDIQKINNMYKNICP